MAIDTAQKRRSVAGNSRRWRAAGVTPQAAKSAAWRRDAGRTYSGNTAGYGGATTDQFTVSGRTVQDLFSPSGMSYTSHVTRQTN